MHPRLSASGIALGVLLLGACDTNSTPAALRSCQAIAQGTPSAAVIRAGTAITVAVTADGGCPLPLVRNETPTIIQVDSIGVLTFRVTGRAIGDGRIRIRSGVDTLVTQVLSFTVVAP